jgi:hypothetical protein
LCVRRGPAQRKQSDHPIHAVKIIVHGGHGIGGMIQSARHEDVSTRVDSRGVC